jgi:predicted nucleotidyltransferase component of viral defense system
MQDLIEQERFELEMLERLNSGRFLRSLIFGGGTMLRLCHGLDRFSVDLDFWLVRRQEAQSIFTALQAYLSRYYSLKDAADKFHTLLFELRSPTFPRSLKIEIRKEAKKIQTEQSIAFSPSSTKQVLLRTVSLRDMMSSKIAAFLDRGEIRDAFDMEFLVKKGICPEAEAEIIGEILRRLDALTPKDYSVKLGSLLPAEIRSYYRQRNFVILKAAIQK